MHHHLGLWSHTKKHRVSNVMPLTCQVSIKFSLSHRWMALKGLPHTRFNIFGQSIAQGLFEMQGFDQTIDLLAEAKLVTCKRANIIQTKQLYISSSGGHWLNDWQNLSATISSNSRRFHCRLFVRLQDDPKATEPISMKPCGETGHDSLKNPIYVWGDLNKRTEPRF